MRFRATLILLGVFVALCAAYWLMRLSEDRAVQTAIEAKRVFDFDASDLRTVSVQQAGEAPTVGKRLDDGSWAITEPYAVPANPIVWNRLAEALASLSNEHTVDEEATDLWAYALDAPVLTLKAITASGVKLSAYFGAVEPTQTYRYAQANDGPVFLVKTDAFFELDRSLELLRDRSLFHVGEQGITRITYARCRPLPEGAAPDPNAPPELAHGEESIPVVVQRSPAGVWQLLEPIEGRANQEMIGDLVKELQFAVGHDYVDAPESLADYRLDPPGARVTILTGPDSRPQTAYFGGIRAQAQSNTKARQGGSANPERSESEGTAFVKRADLPAVFSSGAHIWNLFPKTVDAFRENRILTFPLGSILSIHYVRGETDVTLINNPQAGWQLAAPSSSPQGGAEPTDQVAVSHFIAALGSFKGEQFFDTKKPEFSLDAPTVSITFTLKDQAQPITILVGATTPAGDQFYVTQDSASPDGAGIVTLLKAVEVNQIILDRFDFRAKTLLAFSGDQAAHVAVTLDGVEYAFDHAGEVWRVTSPPDKVWERQTDMAALLKALNPVKAVKAESDQAPADLSPYGLDAPVAKVEVTAASKDDPSKQTKFGPLLIGKPCPDDAQQRFANTPTRPEVFRIDQSVMDDIRQALKGVRPKD